MRGKYTKYFKVLPFGSHSFRAYVGPFEGKYFFSVSIRNIQLLPKDIQNILISVEKNTNMGENMTFLLMLAYSGQDEIIR